MSTIERPTDCGTALHHLPWQTSHGQGNPLFRMSPCYLFSIKLQLTFLAVKPVSLGCASCGFQSLCRISGLPEKLFLCVHQKIGVTSFTRLRFNLRCPETVMKFSYKISCNLLVCAYVSVCGSAS